ncbi:MAG TPA: energy transducer TonB [Flavobacterium sp.]|nr:energy transducer TonB [Flavobacterium sp.]
MKIFLFLVITLFAIQMVSAQESELLMETELVSSPDVSNPKFNGGELNKFYEFINQEFNKSTVSKAGKIVVSFTVTELGEVKKIKVLEFPNVEAASEIIRVLNKSPKWEPAKRAGNPFSVVIKMPLIFKEKIHPQSTSNPDSIGKELDLVKVSNEGTSNLKEFPGGLNNFKKFVSENYHQPEVEGLFGNVIVSFAIDVDGSLVDIKVIKDLGFGTGKEAIRVLKLCSKKWTPAVRDGKPVRSEFTMPINIDTR